MYREISITNFRGFPKFRMHDLGRVNLLVGTNNSGKSTLLEAIELLSSFGNPRSLWAVTSRRGEQIWYDDRRRKREGAVAHLFHGHEIELGSEFSVRGNHHDFVIDTFVSKIGEKHGAQKQLTLFSSPSPSPSLEFSEEYIGPYSLIMEWKFENRGNSAFRSALTARGGLPFDDVIAFHRTGNSNPPVRYITTSSMSVEQVARLFDDIVLTNEEAVLIDALKTIEPSIERIASLGSESRRSSSSRGNIVLKCKGIDQRIPIGTMGDGIWRMLGIAIALVTAENGFLLVDEIDTGLHYSVMADMWRLVERTAARLNVQVFATTHSRDCYESLATIARESVTEDSQVTIQRIERDKCETVAFNERDIVIAAERGLEVR